jgi:hypothetical protein
MPRSRPSPREGRWCAKNLRKRLAADDDFSELCDNSCGALIETTDFDVEFASTKRLDPRDRSRNERLRVSRKMPLPTQDLPNSSKCVGQSAMQIREYLRKPEGQGVRKLRERFRL